MSPSTRDANKAPHERGRKRKLADWRPEWEKNMLAELRRIPPATEPPDPQDTKEQREAAMKRHRKECDDVRQKYAEYRYEEG